MSESNLPKIAVSWGEFFDKITILELKVKYIKNPTANSNVTRELDYTLSILQSMEIDQSNIQDLKVQLFEINKKLWNIEDQIREKERHKIFDDGFIQLARSVYHENDKRAEIKRKINEVLGSYLVEEKSYQKY